ncbi:hypothetical protein GCM10027610_001710 [Dactylosporangium cerinum]
MVAGLDVVDDLADEHGEDVVEEGHAVGTGVQVPPAAACEANRSVPRAAKVRATGSWPAVRTCTATRPAPRTVGHAEAALATQKETSGGSSETDVKEVAVNPVDGSPGAVTTTTAAA